MAPAIDALAAIAPSIAFLLAAVPFAHLLGVLGFFDAVVAVVARRAGRVPVWALWCLAAVTTAVLNLDTTVVLLTPLVVRLARRADVDPLPLAAVPLLLAGLASSFLPVANLTTLIVADRFDLGAGDVLAALGPPSAVAVVVGWLVHRRRVPRDLVVAESTGPDRRALVVGGSVVFGLLVWFSVGEASGVPPWPGLVVAVVVLAVATRTVPWRTVPFATAALVAAGAAAVGAVAPDGLGSDRFWAADGAVAGALVVGAATVTANLVNNLPATLVAIDPDATMTAGRWLWLLGVNVGSSVLPIGSLASLLWWRLVAEDRVAVDLRGYVRLVVPVVVPALVAAGAVALVTVSSVGTP